ncbi:MAG: hypothetical protein Q8K65_02330 [Alphaproteobacteria bacterium]|nr:hypothetical protein [Alphaproteobacteria bacterium]
MSQDHFARLMRQIEIQHTALCTDYSTFRENNADPEKLGEEKLERIAHMYWQLRTQITLLADTKKVEVEFR